MLTRQEELRLRNVMAALWNDLTLVASVKGAQVVEGRYGNNTLRIRRGSLLLVNDRYVRLYVMPDGATEPQDGVEIQPYDEGPWWPQARTEITRIEEELQAAIDRQRIIDLRAASAKDDRRQAELARAAAICRGIAS
jgi:hypothetical protein